MSDNPEGSLTDRNDGTLQETEESAMIDPMGMNAIPDAEKVRAAMVDSMGMKAMLDAEKPRVAMVDSMGMKAMLDAEKNRAAMVAPMGMKAMLDTEKARAAMVDSMGMKAMLDVEKARAAMVDSMGMKAMLDVEKARVAMVDSMGMKAMLDAEKNRATMVAPMGMKAILDAKKTIAAMRAIVVSPHNLELSDAFRQLKTLSHQGSGFESELREASNWARATFVEIEASSESELAPEAVKQNQGLRELGIRGSRACGEAPSSSSAETPALSAVDDMWSTVTDLASAENSTETALDSSLAREWYAFSKYMRGIADALHTKDGELIPKAYPVGAVMLAMLPGPWRLLGAFMIVSLFLRDIRTRLESNTEIRDDMGSKAE